MDSFTIPSFSYSFAPVSRMSRLGVFSVSHLALFRVRVFSVSPVSLLCISSLTSRVSPLRLLCGTFVLNPYSTKASAKRMSRLSKLRQHPTSVTKHYATSRNVAF